MTTSTSPRKPPPGESPRRFAMLISALMGALMLGAVVAHQRAEAHPVDMDDTAASAWLRRAAQGWGCPPNDQGCNSQRPTTTRPPTTTQRPTQGIGGCPPNDQGCNSLPPPTTTRRPVTTTTRRPVTTTTRRPVTTTTRRPVTTTTRRPVTTTTRRPVTTTTRRPVTTTTRRPPPTTTIATTGCGSWACNEVNAGIDNDYLPEDFDPSRPTQTEELLEIIEAYGEHNPNFDTDAALEALQDAGHQTDRGDMFNALAAGLDMDYDPDNPFEVADELADMGILLGHDRNGDGIADPYIRPDADPDSTMTNEQLAAFLDRIPTAGNPGGHDGGPSVNRPPGEGRPPGGGGDPDDEMCTTGLALTYSGRAAFAAQLRWETLVGIEAQSEPGVPWPPHPDVPGGAEFLLVSQSPVWPVVDPGAQWYAVADDGCLWVATGVQTRVSQLLPWRTDHRRVLENAGTFGVYLRRWDNLTSGQQAQAIQRHRNRDLDVRCPLETAMVSQDSYNQCRWELPVSGVWSWQARACFEADTGYTTYRDCATLASGVEWFLGIIDYTSGITLHHDPDGRAGAAPRHPAPAG